MTPSSEAQLSPPDVGEAKPSASKKNRLMLLQLVLTSVAFGYLYVTSDIPKLTRAFHDAPLWSIPCCTLTLLGVVFAGTVRWQLLLRAYGARTLPNLGYLFRLQLIGLFYNMMPGAVGGDLLRGWISRRAFGEQGASAGITVVLVERVFGLIGLMLLVLGLLVVHPIPGLDVPAWMLGAGLAGGVVSLFAIALGRRLGPRLPAVLAARAAELPELSNVPAFALAMIVSLVNQSLVGVMGHIAVSPLAPNQVKLIDSLVLSPIAFAAIFFPFTVAGAGTRDAAMRELYGKLGVAPELALTASLEILVAYVLVAAIGGLLSVVTSLDADDALTAPEPQPHT